MPQVKKFKSLEKLCLQNIARNIEFWHKKCVLPEENRLESLMDFVGPFDKLRKLNVVYMFFLHFAYNI